MRSAAAEGAERLGRLADAAREASAAYHAIFGRSAWNARDRQAFRQLEFAIEAADQYLIGAGPPRLHQSLTRKLRRRRCGCH